MLDEREKLRQWRAEAQKNGLLGSELLAWEFEKIRRELADIKLELKLQRLGESPHHKTGKKQKPE